MWTLGNTELVFLHYEAALCKIVLHACDNDGKRMTAAALDIARGCKRVVWEYVRDYFYWSQGELVRLPHNLAIVSKRSSNRNLQVETVRCVETAIYQSSTAVGRPHEGCASDERRTISSYRTKA
jgi:hypothetical protein